MPTKEEAWKLVCKYYNEASAAIYAMSLVHTKEHEMDIGNGYYDELNRAGKALDNALMAARNELLGY